MKNKLLKRLTTMVVAAAMVATMVTGFSVDVKAYDIPVLTPELRGYCKQVDEKAVEFETTFDMGGEPMTLSFQFLLDDKGYSFESIIEGAFCSESSGTDFSEIIRNGNSIEFYREYDKESYPDHYGMESYTLILVGKNVQSVIYKHGEYQNYPVTEFIFSREVPTPDPDPDPAPKKEKKSESKYIAPKEENPAFTHPDRVKLMSILPTKTVTALNGGLVDDLKVLAASDTTKANQSLLVNNFATTAGKKARILVSDSLYTSRMLGGDNGKTRTLKWVNLEKNPQIVYACCYNQTDKAYFIQGILDKDGTATFNDFILRDMTNITIFVLE